MIRRKQTQNKGLFLTYLRSMYVAAFQFQYSNSGKITFTLFITSISLPIHYLKIRTKAHEFTSNHPFIYYPPNT